MSTHYDDEAQVEDLRRWWKENWLPLAAGLAIGLAAIFGWQAWNRSRDAHRAEGSQIFDELKKTVAGATYGAKYDEAVKMADRLVKDFSNTPYAAAGALKMARIAVEADKLDEAHSRLAWVAEHGNDPALKPLVQLRLARVVWQQGKPEDALKLLDGGTTGSDATVDPYAGLYAELRGDIKLAQGDRTAARAAYEQALQKLDPKEAPGRESLQQKLDDLADAAVVPS